MAKMEVILKEDVKDFGEEGDIVTVSSGYGRNYLIPNRLAVYKTVWNLKQLIKSRTEIQKRKQEKMKISNSLQARLNELNLIFERRVSPKTKKLFGSIGSKDIRLELREYLTDKEYDKLRVANILISGGNIKYTGDFDVKVQVYQNVSAILKVTVQDVIVDEKMEGEKTNAKDSVSKEENESSESI